MKNREGFYIPHRFPEWVTWLFFGIGLTGAISLRLILVAKAYNPELITLAAIVWDLWERFGK